MGSLERTDKILLSVGAFLSVLNSLSLSQCIPTPPCISCDFAHAHRVSIDCRRYMYCFNGIPGPVLNCEDDEIFSLLHRQCVPHLSALGECHIDTHKVNTDRRYLTRIRNYARFPSTGNGYPYTTPLTGANNYYGYNLPGKAWLPFERFSSKQFPVFRRPGRLLPRPGYMSFGSSSGYPENNRVESSRSSLLGGDSHYQLSENCGVKASNWIVGGQEASPGSWAWQVSLQELNVTSGRWVHVCGGALVHRSWVVTAGHCIHALSGVTSVTAVLGSYNLTFTEPGEVRVNVDRLIGHPDYRHGGNYPNDVGLAHLSTPVRMTRSINTVCLPQQEESVHSKSRTLHGPNSRCWVTGWGRTLGATDAHVLNEAEVQLIDREKCASNWSGYITPSARLVVQGQALGDSGGPLSCIHAGRYYLEGVVSWGEDSCRLAGYPSVFTRLALFTDWIRRTVTSAGTFL